ncbi:Ankyrin-like [Mizuhopecten yessoensis]|uniref:Ankyrin-like n=1 Tax=Mizuhopecten yessoensis TaxID=6573 RepID=A0A210PDA9_MIZYE|nr:Ankyrin-like [Mizuhopecten yessoensis]
MDSDPIFDKGMTCLMVAVIHQQRRLAKYIAAVLPNQLHLRNDDGWDALVFCSMYGDIELFDFLIKQGMNHRTQTQDGLSCLMSAIRNKQLEMAKHIIKSYPRHLHDRDRNSWNVLHHCCHSGNVELFQYLVKKGMKPSTCTYDGSTCLLIAVQNKHFDLIQHIGDKYPEQLEQRDTQVRDVLLCCNKSRDVRIFDYLEKRVKSNTRSEEVRTILKIVSKQLAIMGDEFSKQPKRRNMSGTSLLLRLCKTGMVSIISVLVVMSKM